MESSRSDSATLLTPHESPTYGAAHGADGNTSFGYDWHDRTFGLGIVSVEWTPQGVVAINVTVASRALNQSHRSTVATTKTAIHWELVLDEYLLEVHLYVHDDRSRINALRFVTNCRRSQWFGACTGTHEAIVPPEGCYIHMLHGTHSEDACRQLGAYFVPLRLYNDEDDESVPVSDSRQIYASSRRPSTTRFATEAGTVRAVVVTVGDTLERIWMLNKWTYGRHLAVRETPLPMGTSVFVLVDGERITRLCAWVTRRSIASIQLETTLRTTEWFGPAPGADAVIETLGIDDDPLATHIGGVFGTEATTTMTGTTTDRSLQSIGVVFGMPYTWWNIARAVYARFCCGR